MYISVIITQFSCWFTAVYGLAPPQWCPSVADDFATQPISLNGAGIQNSWRSMTPPKNEKQDGPSLESSSYLNVSLRYLGPLDPGTLEPLDLGILGPLHSSNTSSYFPLHPLPPTLLLLYGLVKGGGWVVTLANEIGDWPLTLGPPPSICILFL